MVGKITNGIATMFGYSCSASMVAMVATVEEEEPRQSRVSFFFSFFLYANTKRGGKNTN